MYEIHLSFCLIDLYKRQKLKAFRQDAFFVEFLKHSPAIHYALKVHTLLSQRQLNVMKTDGFKEGNISRSIVIKFAI